MVKLSISVPENLYKRIITTAKGFGWNKSETIRELISLFSFLYKFMGKHTELLDRKLIPIEDWEKIELIEELMKWI